MSTNIHGYGVSTPLAWPWPKLERPSCTPAPMNEGLEISTDIAHGAQSLVESQVENGVAMRMAVLERYCADTRYTP